MSNRYKDPIIRSLVNAFVPVIVNKDINHHSIQTHKLSITESGKGVCIAIQVVMHKAIPQVVGFEPTHAAVIFDINFNNCKWCEQTETYEWVGGIYDIHYARMSKNILWCDDHGRPLQMFTAQENKDITKKMMIDLFASVNPRTTRAFLESVLASTLAAPA